MRNIPVDLSNFKMRLGADIAAKVKNRKTGEVATDYQTGEVLYVATIYAKQRPDETGYAPNGSEIKVTVKAYDEGLEDGDPVALVAPTMSFYDMTSEDGKRNVGLSFKADKVVPAASTKRRAREMAEPVAA